MARAWGRGARGLTMRCPAGHRPGARVESTTATRTVLFACETPDCPVQTFDVQGAQSVETPESTRPAGGDAEGRAPNGR